MDVDASKPFAPSCERNQDAILGVLQRYLSGADDVLEIGSGTGQHAVYMCQHLPSLRWQTSDLSSQHAGIRAWIRDSGLTNVIEPVELDVNAPVWPLSSTAAIYTANTLHIMSWGSVQAMFARIGQVLKPGGLLLIYGPFNYAGQFTSDGNRRLDEFIKGNDNNSGIRDFEAVNEQAEANGLILLEDIEMPANNRFIVWRRSSFVPPESTHAGWSLRCDDIRAQ